MNLSDVLSALRRRWYVVVATLLLAGGLGYAVWSNVSPDYERTASQLLLPGLATIPEGANPYLYVGGLSQAADIIVLAIGEDEVAAAVEGYPDATMAVGRDLAAGAVLVTTVTASTDEAAAAVLKQSLIITADTLETLQDAQRIPEDERVSMMVLTESTQSTVVQKTRVVLTAITVAGVMLLGLVVAALADGALRTRRRTRRSVRPAQDEMALEEPPHADAPAPPLAAAPAAERQGVGADSASVSNDEERDERLSADKTSVARPRAASTKRTPKKRNPHTRPSSAGRSASTGSVAVIEDESPLP